MCPHTSSEFREMTSEAVYAWLVRLLDEYIYWTRTVKNSEDDHQKKMSENDAVNKFLDLEKEFETTEWDIGTFPLLTTSALIKYILGTFSCNTPEAAEKYLKDAVDIVKPHFWQYDFIFITVSALAKLSALYVDQCRFEESNEALIKIQRILLAFDVKKRPCIASLEGLFQNEKLQKEEVDSYEHKNNHVKVLGKIFSDSLKYHWSRVLRHIFEGNNFESVKWPRNVLRFCNVVLNSKKFRLARHILSCANQLCVKCEEELATKTGSNAEELRKKVELFSADTTMCWGTYVMYFFDHLFRSYSSEKKPEESVFSATDEDDESFLEISKNYESLPANAVQAFEKVVGYTFVSGEDTLRTFHLGLDKLEAGKKYFSFHSTRRNYLAFVNLTIAKLCAYLRFVPEIDMDFKELYQYSMDLLEELLVFFTCGEDPVVYPEIVSELGECCYHYARLGTENDAMTISLIYKAISQFQKILPYPTKCDELSKTLPEDIVLHVLKAYTFYAESLLLVSGSMGEVVECKRMARKCYQMVIKYIKDNPGHEVYVYPNLGTVIQRYNSIIKDLNNTIFNMAEDRPTIKLNSASTE